MSIKLVNIDDRLIHGQIATTWVKDHKIESIIIVNDDVAKDALQVSLAGLAVPGVKVNVFPVAKFLEIIKKTEIKKVTMLLLTNPMDAYYIKNNGFEFDYLNVSGMRFNDNRVRLHKNMSVTNEEKEAFDKLLAQKVEIYMQPTTRDEKVKVEDLLVEYK